MNLTVKEPITPYPEIYDYLTCFKQLSMKLQPVYIVIVFWALLFVTSCCPSEKYYHIKDKDKLRFNENDTFIYKSNLGNYDTLYICEISSEITYRASSEGLCGTDWYKEKIEYRFQNKKNSFKDSLPVLKLDFSDFSDGIIFSAFFHGSPRYDYFGDDIDPYFSGDSVYTNVRYYTYYADIPNTVPYNFFFNKQYGFLSYKYKTGEKYDLFKYIPYEK